MIEIQQKCRIRFHNECSYIRFANMISNATVIPNKNSDMNNDLHICPIWPCLWVKKKLVIFGTSVVQTFRNAYLWNCWTDLLIVQWHLVVQCHEHLAVRPMRAIGLANGHLWNRRTDFFSIRSSMESSKLVAQWHIIVQCYGHLPVWSMRAIWFGDYTDLL